MNTHTSQEISLYLGDSLSPNLVRFLGGLDKVIETSIKLEIIGNNLDTEILPERYSYYELNRKSSEGKIELMRFAYSDIISYIDGRVGSPDAIWQITNPAFHAIPVTIASKQENVPVVTRFPGSCFSEYLHMENLLHKMGAYMLYNIQLRLMEYSDYVVALSEENKRSLIKHGISEENIVILKQPLDTESFSSPSSVEREKIRTELNFDSSSICVLYIGRLSRMKGMDILLETVEKFENNSEYEFHLIGEGEYSNQFAPYDNVVLHGYIPPNKIHKYDKASDILVHPSRIDEEGISWTMLEAAATGLPVAALNVENAADIASFTFSDATELAEYISEPAEWESATYPNSWSVDELQSDYENFFSELCSPTRF